MQEGIRWVGKIRLCWEVVTEQVRKTDKTLSIQRRGKFQNKRMLTIIQKVFTIAQRFSLRRFTTPS